MMTDSTVPSETVGSVSEDTKKVIVDVPDNPDGVVIEKRYMPFNERPAEVHRALSRKGGLARTAKKKRAHQMRGLKERASRGDLDAKRIMELINDPKESSIAIIDFIDSLRWVLKNPKDKLKLAQIMINWHKAHHGDKKITMSVGYKDLQDAMFDDGDNSDGMKVAEELKEEVEGNSTKKENNIDEPDTRDN